MDRIKMAIKVLFVRQIVVVTKNEQFSTMDNSTQITTSKGGLVQWGDYGK